MDFVRMAFEVGPRDPMQRTVLMAVLSLHCGAGKCFATNKAIAEQEGIGLRTVERAIADLTHEGWLFSLEKPGRASIRLPNTAMLEQRFAEMLADRVARRKVRLEELAARAHEALSGSAEDIGAVMAEADDLAERDGFDVRAQLAVSMSSAKAKVDPRLTGGTPPPDRRTPPACEADVHSSNDPSQRNLPSELFDRLWIDSDFRIGMRELDRQMTPDEFRVWSVWLRKTFSLTVGDAKGLSAIYRQRRKAQVASARSGGFEPVGAVRLGR